MGREHVTAAVGGAGRQRINHAYLFSLGRVKRKKRRRKRVSWRSLNCAQGPTANPCGVCESCVSIGAAPPAYRRE